MLAKCRKIKMKLERLPQTPLGFTAVGGAHQDVQRFAVALQQPSGEVGADVAGRAGQEDGHVAWLPDALEPEPALAAAESGKRNSGRCRDSIACPSIKG